MKPLKKSLYKKHIKELFDVDALYHQDREAYHKRVAKFFTKLEDARGDR